MNKFIILIVAAIAVGSTSALVTRVPEVRVLFRDYCSDAEVIAYGYIYDTLKGARSNIYTTLLDLDTDFVQAVPKIEGAEELIKDACVSIKNDLLPILNKRFDEVKSKFSRIYVRNGEELNLTLNRTSIEEIGCPQTDRVGSVLAFCTTMKA